MFDYSLIKKFRVEKLKLSQTDFLMLLNEKSKGQVKMPRDRFTRLENGHGTNVNPTELGFIMATLVEDPNVFFKKE